MKIRNKKRFVVLTVCVVILLLVAGGLFLFGGMQNRSSNDVEGMTQMYLTGTERNYMDSYFKTRNGAEEGGDIIVTLADPPLGRRKATVLVEFINDPINHTSAASMEMKEGETVHIPNDCLAGEFYQIAFTNLSADSEDDDITVHYQVSMDESPADIERPYVG